MLGSTTYSRSHSFNSMIAGCQVIYLVRHGAIDRLQQFGGMETGALLNHQRQVDYVRSF